MFYFIATSGQTLLSFCAEGRESNSFNGIPKGHTESGNQLHVSSKYILVTWTEIKQTFV
jgi:hypothetical protein